MLKSEESHRVTALSCLSAILRATTRIAASRSEPDLGSFALVDKIARSIQLLELHLRMSIVSVPGLIFLLAVAGQILILFVASPSDDSLATRSGSVQECCLFQPYPLR